MDEEYVPSHWRIIQRISPDIDPLVNKATVRIFNDVRQRHPTLVGVFTFNAVVPASVFFREIVLASLDLGIKMEFN